MLMTFLMIKRHCSNDNVDGFLTINSCIEIDMVLLYISILQ